MQQTDPRLYLIWHFFTAQNHVSERHAHPMNCQFGGEKLSLLLGNPLESTASWESQPICAWDVKGLEGSAAESSGIFAAWPLGFTAL